MLIDRCIRVQKQQQQQQKTFFMLQQQSRHHHHSYQSCCCPVVAVKVVLLLVLLFVLQCNRYFTHALPTIILNSKNTKCFLIDAYQDTVIKILYEAPDLDLDDTHPSLSTTGKAILSVIETPYHRVIDTKLHHAPILDRLKPLSHTISKKDGTLYHKMEVDGTAKICIHVIDPKKQHPVDDVYMAFGIRIITSEEEPDLLMTHGKDSKKGNPVDVNQHLTHLEMELQRIATAMMVVLEEADQNVQRDTKFHKQAMELHNASIFWPIVQVCVLLMTGFTQTQHIVHFFKSRRII